jgi:hypothetical protein
MKAVIQDKELLRTIRPLELTTYLRISGWRVSGETNKATFWEHQTEAGETIEILVPRRTDFADFPTRISDALQTLAAVEGRSQLEILSDLTTENADVIRIRSHSRKGEDDGSIVLEDGVLLCEKAREMVLAAACAAIRKQTLFSKRKPEKAMSFLRQVRLGQTERGSYVITLISPVSPELAVGENLPLIETKEPYEREVMLTLANALDATRKAAENAMQQGRIDPFHKAVNQGASANLLEAVTGLSEAGGDKDVEISFSWSRSRTVPGEKFRRIVLPQDTIPIVREAARVFRATTPQEDVELRGAVVKLERSEGAGTGKVTIVGEIEDRQRRVTVELSATAYDEAIKAHKEEIPVICAGELVKEGNSFVLRNPHSFALLTEA